MFKKIRALNFHNFALSFAVVSGVFSTNCSSGVALAEEGSTFGYTKTVQSRVETSNSGDDSKAPTGTRPVHSLQAKRERVSDSAFSTNDGRTPLGFDTDDAESALESNMNAKTGESLHKLDNRRVDGQ